MTLHQAADAFTGSVEFQRRYGSLDDDAFVDLLYHNVLGRDADALGLRSWTNAMAAGMSRAEVVSGFSESTEHQIITAPYVDDGVWLL